MGRHDGAGDAPASRLLRTGPIAIRGLSRGVRDAVQRQREASRHRAEEHEGDLRELESAFVDRDDAVGGAAEEDRPSGPAVSAGGEGESGDMARPSDEHEQPDWFESVEEPGGVAAADAATEGDGATPQDGFSGGADAEAWPHDADSTPDVEDAEVGVEPDAIDSPGVADGPDPDDGATAEEPDAVDEAGAADGEDVDAVDAADARDDEDSADRIAVIDDGGAPARAAVPAAPDEDADRRHGGDGAAREDGAVDATGDRVVDGAVSTGVAVDDPPVDGSAPEAGAIGGTAADPETAQPEPVEETRSTAPESALDADSSSAADDVPEEGLPHDAAGGTGDGEETGRGASHRALGATLAGGAAGAVVAAAAAGSRPAAPPSVRRRVPLRDRVGREAVGIAVLVVLALVCAGLIAAVVVKTRNDAAIAAREAAAYTPPPLTGSAAAAGTTVAVIGDETVTRAAPGIGASKRWPRLLGDALGADVETDASTGAGYVSKGADGRTFVQQAALVPSNASTVLFVGGAADAGTSSVKIAAAATRAFAAAKDQAPDAAIVVVGPLFTPLGTSSADLTDLTNALRSSARIADARWVDPIGSKWFSAVAAVGGLSGSDERAIASRLRKEIAASEG